jgi:hypothetical protein
MTKSFRIGKLNTVQDVVRETCKLYRRVAHGHLDSSDGARQSSILQNVRQGMEQSLIELRLTTIEDTILRLASQKSQPILINSQPSKEDE